MGKRTKTVQSNLFLTYSLIIITILIIFVSFFYYWVSNLLKDYAVDRIAALSGSTSDQLDIEIQKMNDVSMNVSYSSAVKDRFMKYIDNPYKPYGALLDENRQETDYIFNTKELIDILFAIIGPNRPVQQIYLFDFNGNVFGTGTDNRQQNISVKDKPWYKDVMQQYGKKYITRPLKDEELSKFVTRSGKPYFISVCRVYFDNYNTPQGIVEVKQYYDEIFKGTSGSIRSNNDVLIYVYDDTGSLVYPMNETTSSKDSYYYKLSKTVSSGNSPLSFNNPFTGGKELLCYKRSDFTGWTTVAVISESKLLSPVFSFARILVLVAVFILLLSLAFSFFAAKKITVPIARLNKAIKAFNLESPVTQIPAELSSGLNELENLNQTFFNMNVKLKNSHNELILAHQHEMQARMLALQSQMNPHFLYNTLATISVMAEESMDEQVVEMCSNVSDMLRYISSDKSTLVKLSNELEYTEKYLACMKSRYGNKLDYSIELDEEMKDIKIPRLVIQPLVENALKYGTRREPPWIIQICGQKANTYWQISVQDNGTGFDPERLKQIREKIGEVEQDGLLPGLELEGMGLLNIYMRLKLSYKNQMIFQIADSISDGAIVVIGGSL